MFATFDNHHHGAPHVGVWLAMPLGAQEALVYQDPKRFFVPALRGPARLGRRAPRRPPELETVEKVVREAYDFTPSPRGSGREGAQRATTRPPSGTAAPRGPRR